MMTGFFLLLQKIYKAVIYMFRLSKIQFVWLKKEMYQMKKF